MPAVTDEQVVAAIKSALKTRADLTKYTLNSFVSVLERKLSTSLSHKARFLQKEIDGHLLEAFEDVSPAEDMVIHSPVKLKVKRESFGRRQSLGASKPVGGFHKFQEEMRSTVESENPDANGSEVMKLLSEKWTNLTDVEKQAYEPAMKRESGQRKLKLDKPHKISKPGKKKKKGGLPDSAPKKPLTSYFLFCNEKRKELTESDPTANVTQMAKNLGEMWRTLNESEKAVYENRANEAKAKWAEDLKQWMAENPDAVAAGKSKSKNKDPNKPKKALSAFFFFGSARRPKLTAETPSLTIIEVASKLGEEWGKMSPEAKQPYEELAAKDKLRYEEEMKHYTPPPGGAIAKPKKATKSKAPRKPKAKKNDGFLNDDESSSESGDGSSDSSGSDSDTSNSDSDSNSDSSSSSSSSSSGSDSSTSSDSSSESDGDKKNPAANGAQATKRAADGTTNSAPKKRKTIADEED
mmetsp:Transcript_130859/g.226452  ORF Transcript_130859/g.226452 Transcript_130859/m.226452 type:complete len:466 (-) Transcript_130859:12-1409(-)